MNGQHNFYLLGIATLVSVGGILYGYDIGVVSGALLFIQKTIPLSDMQTGLIVGAVLGGSLIGTLLAGPIGDYFGRRKLILVASIIFIAGIIFILLANQFLVLFLARVLLGLGVGVIAVAVPLYIAEIVPSQDRGKYVTFFQLLLTFGILLAYFVDLLFTPTGNWRAMFAVLLIPSIILFIGVFILPESPRWLVAVGQEQKAIEILKRIYKADVKEHILAIQHSLLEIQGSWADFFSPKMIFPLFVAISIAIFNQLTGINSFLQYAPIILKNAGLNSDMVSMLGSVGVGMLNFIFTIVAILLIDTVGRRPLLLTGLLGVIIAEIYLGAIHYFIPDSSYAGLLSLIGLFIFIVFFAIGPGVVVWLAISELFPTQNRGKGIAICLFFNSLASTILAIFFLLLIKHLGTSFTYWLFALFSLAYFLVVFFYLPETKAKTLEDIQKDLFKNA